MKKEALQRKHKSSIQSISLEDYLIQQILPLSFIILASQLFSVHVFFQSSRYFVKSFLSFPYYYMKICSQSVVIKIENGGKHVQDIYCKGVVIDP